MQHDQETNFGLLIYWIKALPIELTGPLTYSALYMYLHVTSFIYMNKTFTHSHTHKHNTTLPGLNFYKTT